MMRASACERALPATNSVSSGRLAGSCANVQPGCLVTRFERGADELDHHRRRWLGGLGARDWAPATRRTGDDLGSRAVSASKSLRRIHQWPGAGDARTTATPRPNRERWPVGNYGGIFHRRWPARGNGTAAAGVVYFTI